ncbi:hypothetical protein AURDEDRAFT_128013 [Auricularia subglabra TFB-10046 SS5]|nr:hypothetical protein AURDEDRAFT_128013 [Auricularia subglabra TFB-10046 SS5]
MYVALLAVWAAFPVVIPRCRSFEVLLAASAALGLPMPSLLGRRRWPGRRWELLIQRHVTIGFAVASPHRFRAALCLLGYCFVLHAEFWCLGSAVRSLNRSRRLTHHLIMLARALWSYWWQHGDMQGGGRGGVWDLGALEHVGGEESVGYMSKETLYFRGEGAARSGRDSEGGNRLVEVFPVHASPVSSSKGDANGGGGGGTGYSTVWSSHACSSRTSIAVARRALLKAAFVAASAAAARAKAVWLCGPVRAASSSRRRRLWSSVAGGGCAAVSGSASAPVRVCCGRGRASAAAASVDGSSARAASRDGQRGQCRALHLACSLRRLFRAKAGRWASVGLRLGACACVGSGKRIGGGGCVESGHDNGHGKREGGRRCQAELAYLLGPVMQCRHARKSISGRRGAPAVFATSSRMSLRTVGSEKRVVAGYATRRVHGSSKSGCLRQALLAERDGLSVCTHSCMTRGSSDRRRGGGQVEGARESSGVDVTRGIRPRWACLFLELQVDQALRVLTEVLGVIHQSCMLITMLYSSLSRRRSALCPVGTGLGKQGKAMVASISVYVLEMASGQSGRQLQLPSGKVARKLSAEKLNKTEDALGGLEFVGAPERPATPSSSCRPTSSTSIVRLDQHLVHFRMLPWCRRKIDRSAVDGEIARRFVDDAEDTTPRTALSVGRSAVRSVSRCCWRLMSPLEYKTPDGLWIGRGSVDAYEVVVQTDLAGSVGQAAPPEERGGNGKIVLRARLPIVRNDGAALGARPPSDSVGCTRMYDGDACLGPRRAHSGRRWLQNAAERLEVESARAAIEEAGGATPVQLTHRQGVQLNGRETSTWTERTPTWRSSPLLGPRSCDRVPIHGDCKWSAMDELEGGIVSQAARREQHEAYLSVAIDEASQPRGVLGGRDSRSRRGRTYCEAWSSDAEKSRARWRGSWSRRALAPVQSNAARRVKQLVLETAARSIEVGAGATETNGTGDAREHAVQKEQPDADKGQIADAGAARAGARTRERGWHTAGDGASRPRALAPSGPSSSWRKGQGARLLNSTIIWGSLAIWAVPVGRTSPEESAIVLARHSHALQGRCFASSGPRYAL